MDVRILKNVRIFIIVGSVIASFVIWIMLPNIVPIHFMITKPDAFGHKLIILFLVLPPFAGLIPWRAEKLEIRDTTMSDEMKEMLQEDEEKKTEIFHTVFAVVMCLLSISLLMLSYVNS